MIGDPRLIVAIEEHMKTHDSISLAEVLLMKEAIASTDLDKGDGETHAL